MTHVTQRSVSPGLGHEGDYPGNDVVGDLEVGALEPWLFGQRVCVA